MASFSTFLDATTSNIGYPISDLPATTANYSMEAVNSAYRHVSICLAWLTLAICIFGAIGNMFSIIIYSDPTMRAPINVLLLGTSYIDFALSLLSVPTFVIPGMFAYYSTPTLQTIMAYSSAYVYPLTLMMQSASVWAFVIITIERYQAVCRPFQTRWSTIHRSRMAVVAVCVLAIAYNAVRFFEFQIQYVHEGSYIDVVPFLRNDANYMNIYYIGMFLVTHFVVPFSILVILNALIIRTICQSRQRRKQLNRKERSEHRTATMMVIVVLTFIFCYTLLFVLNILEAADPNWFYNSPHMALAFALNDISNVLIVFNAASSIIVYYSFSQKYRTLLIQKLTRFCPNACSKYVAVPRHEIEEDHGQSRKKAPSLSKNVTPNLEKPNSNLLGCQKKISLVTSTTNTVLTDKNNVDGITDKGDARIL